MTKISKRLGKTAIGLATIIAICTTIGMLIIYNTEQYHAFANVLLWTAFWLTLLIIIVLLTFLITLFLKTNSKK